MAYKNIKLVDFKPDPTLTGLDNALARKAHYDSEMVRIKAAELIQRYKVDGTPIQVQGSQDD